MELDQQLTNLTKEVGNVQAQISREEGQLEAAKEFQARMVQKCKKLGVEPEQLDMVITEKEQELVKLLQEIEVGLTDVKEKRDAIIATADKSTTEV